MLTEEFSFGRTVRPAYTIKTPSLAKRFQLSNGITHGWHHCVFSTVGSDELVQDLWQDRVGRCWDAAQAIIARDKGKDASCQMAKTIHAQ